MNKEKKGRKGYLISLSCCNYIIRRRERDRKLIKINKKVDSKEDCSKRKLYFRNLIFPKMFPRIQLTNKIIIQLEKYIIGSEN